MSSILSEYLIQIYQSYGYQFLTNTFGLQAIVLLLALLLEKEFILAFGSSRQKNWLKILNLAIYPLLLAFALIVIVRFLILLFP